MNDNASRAVVLRAYEVFRRYDGGVLHDTSGSDCSDDRIAESISSDLNAKPLHELDRDDLLDYFYLAVDHIGTISQFKHFLPRILELWAEEPSETFTGEELLRIVRQSGAASWPLEERAVLRDFFRAVPDALGKYGTPEDVETALLIGWTERLG